MNDKTTIKTRMEWHKKNAGFQAEYYFDITKIFNEEDNKRFELQVQFKKFCLSQNLRMNNFTLKFIQHLISKIIKGGLSTQKAQEILVEEFGENSSISDKEKSYLATKKP